MNYISAFSDFVAQSNICKALGWTVVHSIWQGALVGLFAWLMLRWYRQSTAAFRYHVALFALFSMTDLAASTFFYYYQRPNLSFWGFDLFQRIGIVSHTGGGAFGTSSEGILQTLLNSFAHFLDQNIFWIVGIWSIGVAFLGFRMLSGLWFIQQLRRTVEPVTASLEEWREVLKECKNQLKIQYPIDLFESKKVRTPVALGWIRPMILMPVGLLNSLSPDEVEVVLAHELAHIKSKDYLVNILQSIVEILFHYHPIVWWLSSMVRREREHRCDDWAVSIYGDPVLYAKTLVKVQEMTTSQYQRIEGDLAMGFSKEPKKILLERVKRILIFSKKERVFTKNHNASNKFESQLFPSFQLDWNRFFMEKLTAISLLVATAIGVSIAFSPYAAPRMQAQITASVMALFGNNLESTPRNPYAATLSMTTTDTSPTAADHSEVLETTTKSATAYFTQLQQQLGNEMANQVWENLSDHNNINSMQIEQTPDGKAVVVSVRRLNGNLHTLRVNGQDNTARLARLPVQAANTQSSSWSTQQTTQEGDLADPTFQQMEPVENYLRNKKMLPNKHHQIKISEAGLWIDGVLQSNQDHKNCLQLIDCKRCTLELEVNEE